MALNDSCHLLIETKHHVIQKSGGLQPLSPIASTPLVISQPQAARFRCKIGERMQNTIPLTVIEIKTGSGIRVWRKVVFPNRN